MNTALLYRFYANRVAKTFPFADFSFISHHQSVLFIENFDIIHDNILVLTPRCLREASGKVFRQNIESARVRNKFETEEHSTWSEKAKMRKCNDAGRLPTFFQLSRKFALNANCRNATFKTFSTAYSVGYRRRRQFLSLLF